MDEDGFYSYQPVADDVSYCLGADDCYYWNGMATCVCTGNDNVYAALQDAMEEQFYLTQCEDELKRTALRCNNLKKTLEQARKTIKKTATIKTNRGKDESQGSDDEFDDVWGQPLHTQYIREESDDEPSEIDESTDEDSVGEVNLFLILHLILILSH